MPQHEAALIRERVPAEQADDYMQDPGTWSGNVSLVCQCGYNSGWVNADSIRDAIWTHHTRPGLERTPFSKTR
ncbi:hypothetical protein ACWIFI_18740 [Streptomyces albidoflavus]